MTRVSARVFFAVALVALTVGGSPVLLQGQNAATEWLRVNHVNVVPERMNDYIEIQLEEVNPALQRAGVPWRSVWRTAEFGNTYELTFVTPIVDFEDFDTGGPLARVMEPERFRRVVDRLRRFTASRRGYAVRYRQDLSIESDEVSGLFLARVSTVQVAPGRVADWEAFLSRTLPTFRDANVVFGVYERVFGPGPTAWQVVENHASFLDLAQPSIVTRAFGDQADVVSSELAGVVQSVERSVLRYDAELSYSSPATSSETP